MFLRLTVGIHKTTIDSVVKTYDLVVERWFRHATSTLFNAGTPKAADVVVAQNSVLLVGNIAEGSVYSMEEGCVSCSG